MVFFEPRSIFKSIFWPPCPAGYLVYFLNIMTEHELGLTKIFFKPAKAAVLDEIMENKDKPLTAEQNARTRLTDRNILLLVGVKKAKVL